MPLLVEGGPVRTQEFDLVVVVETPMPLRLARLAERGLAPDQARARIAAQASDEQRRAVADEVVGNDGTLAELEIKVDGLWARIRAGRPGKRLGTGERVEAVSGNPLESSPGTCLVPTRTWLSW